MLIRRAPMFPESDVTDETVYLNRRAFMTGLGAVALVGASARGDAAAQASVRARAVALAERFPVPGLAWTRA